MCVIHFCIDVNKIQNDSAKNVSFVEITQPRLVQHPPGTM